MITLSCGHTIDSFKEDHYNVMVKGYTEENDKCVNYMSVCDYCYDDYKTHNEILETDELADHWLEIKGKTHD